MKTPCLLGENLTGSMHHYYLPSDGFIIIHVTGIVKRHKIMTWFRPLVQNISVTLTFFVCFEQTWPGYHSGDARSGNETTLLWEAEYYQQVGVCLWDNEWWLGWDLGEEERGMMGGLEGEREARMNSELLFMCYFQSSESLEAMIILNVHICVECYQTVQ